MSAAITIVCPNCKNKMRASAEYLGRKGRCPACKALVEIVAEDSSLATLSPATRGGGRAKAPHVSTDVNGLVAAGFGLLATVVLYAVVFFPIRASYLGQLFADRGTVPYITTWVACWGFALLAMKYLAVKRQMAAAERELELIPLEIGVQITPENVDQFLGHLATLPSSQQGSILARRIRGAIEHFKYRNSVPEVQGYLASQAEIDASGVDGGYTLLRSIVWAVPILGFIGTVVGISAAVQNLADVMPRKDQTTENQPADATPAAKPTKGAPAGSESFGTKLMGAMGSVTKNLAVAFDTTLVALALAIFLLFMTESLRKTEYGMLDRIEQFANESLLRRMVEKDAVASIGESPQLVRDALDAAFREHQRWLAQWQAQVGELGRVIGADFESAAVGVQQRLADSERQRVDAVRDAARLVEELFGKLSQTAVTLERSAQVSMRDVGTSLSAAERLQTALSENSHLLTQLLEQERQLLMAAAAAPPAPSADVPSLDLLATVNSGRVADGRSFSQEPSVGLWKRMLGRK